MRRIQRGIAVAGPAIGVLLAVVGCGAASVGSDEVAAQISAELTEKVGQKPDSVTCSEDLPAEEGATIQCDLETGGDTLGVTVTVTSVQGTNVQYDTEVEDP